MATGYNCQNYFERAMAIVDNCQTFLVKVLLSDDHRLLLSNVFQKVTSVENCQNYSIRSLPRWKINKLILWCFEILMAIFCINWGGQIQMTKSLQWSATPKHHFFGLYWKLRIFKKYWNDSGQLQGTPLNYKKYLEYSVVYMY